MAAMGGHLHVLQWARAHHCPWDERTIGMAAQGGHLEVLQWAQEHGCPAPADLHLLADDDEDSDDDSNDYGSDGFVYVGDPDYSSDDTTSYEGDHYEGDPIPSPN
jgi:hypothetical protein